MIKNNKLYKGVITQKLHQDEIKNIIIIFINSNFKFSDGKCLHQRH